jgi:hypothetical protein
MFTSSCAYCNRQPEAPLTHGIDRVDNDKGYTPENTVASCARCNYMKHKYDCTSFIEQCQAVSDAQRTPTLDPKNRFYSRSYITHDGPQ